VEEYLMGWKDLSIFDRKGFAQDAERRFHPTLNSAPPVGKRFRSG